jgi:hypothetical protein
MVLDGSNLAGKVADMSATCRPDSQKSALLADSAKSCRHNFVPDTFFVSGFADFLQIFSKYQRYIRSNHRTNWYINIKQSVQPGYFFAPLTYYIILSTQSRNILLYQETASHNIASHNFCRRLIHINQYQDECSSSAPCWSCYSK